MHMLLAFSRARAHTPPALCASYTANASVCDLAILDAYASQGRGRVSPGAQQSDGTSIELRVRAYHV